MCDIGFAVRMRLIWEDGMRKVGMMAVGGVGMEVSL
jgi:hypothetical protein